MSQTISNPDEFRTNVRTKLTQLIEDDIVALNLEKGVFNYALREANHKKILKKWTNSRFAQLYVDRLRTIYVNLKNPELLTHLKSKEISPQTLAFMTHQEMNPDRWRDLLNKKNIIDANKYNANVEASTDLFTCPKPKCRSRRCTYYTLQVRSADEPESIFVTCLDCGKNFRKG
jgi:DNA-directed RNA polymerase subunit M/transcription elongation factor TFIIS